MEKQRTYFAIDLKSFYASVECVERGLDPLKTNLVVADISRTQKTICLAITPPLKAYGLGGRARLFEVEQCVRKENLKRCKLLPSQQLKGKSASSEELEAHPELAIDYIVAKPRMAFYMHYSSLIKSIYVKFFSNDDILVYSVDEVFCDATPYMKMYNTTSKELAKQIIQAIYEETGITATAGIGTNIYLAKIAMDIVAKHIAPDKDNVRIAELNERTFREQLWNHRPLTDFWQIGRSTANKLTSYGIETIGDLARCSLKHEQFLFRLFGKGAELLIDHAWGWEPITIHDIKEHEPKSRSLCNGQVLHEPYTARKAKVVLKEMTEELAFRLVNMHLFANAIDLTIGYDVSNLTNPEQKEAYQGTVVFDHHGRQVPKRAHASETLSQYTSSTRLFTAAACRLFDKIVNPQLLIRRISITFSHVISEEQSYKLKEKKSTEPVQLSLFSEDNKEKMVKEEENDKSIKKEQRLQETVLSIKKRYGKNAILKGLNFEEGATGKERNKQRGGHSE